MLHTAVASHNCPGNDLTLATRPPISRRANAASVLVPGGAVAVTVCRYNGMNGATRYELVGAGSSGHRDTVAKLTRALDALKPRPPGAVVNCPADLSADLTATFAYRSGPVVTLLIDTTGCASVTNGRRKVPAPAAVVAELATLARRTAVRVQPIPAPAPPMARPAAA